MPVRACIGDAETQHDAIDETRFGCLRAGRGKVIACMEHEFVFAGDEGVAFEQRRVATAVVIGGGVLIARRVSPESAKSSTLMPAPGRPFAVSSTWVVSLPIRSFPCVNCEFQRRPDPEYVAADRGSTSVATYPAAN